MKQCLFLLCFLLSIFSASPAQAQESQGIANAKAAALAWLAVVDAGHYAQSWDQGAVLFQEGVPKAQWESAVESARLPLGAVKSRQLTSATFARSLPGAPDGEYVVILFETDFQSRAAAVETVTPMREKDGSWKVSGYFIK